MDASIHIPLRTCVLQQPDPWATTPPGFEWIPAYLNQYGGQMTDYGRHWLITKWQEPYQAALEAAERDYQDCLRGGTGQPEGGKPGGLQLQVAAKLDAQTPRRGGALPSGLSTRLEVPFHPAPPIAPAPSPSVPRSVFWIGTSATYDLVALHQAMRPVNRRLNPAHPLSLRDVRLTADGVKAAVRLGGHRFLPIPAQVQPFDDLHTHLAVSTIRLDFSAEWANNGAVLDTWAAESSGGANPAAATDFYCYYLGCAGWASPPPLFNWNLVPSGCIEDLVFRALPTAITQVQVVADNGETLDTITLSNSTAGTIASRPVVARHRIFNSPGMPQVVLPEVSAGPAAPGEPVEMEVTLPECLVGKVELAPANIQDFSLFQSDGVIEVSAEPGATPGTIKLLLTLQRPVYHWDRDVDIRFLPLGGVDMGYPPSGWFPHVVLRVPVAWNGCDAFNPAADSQAKLVVTAWTTTQHVHWPGGPVVVPWRWTHSLALRVVDYAAPYDAFDCLWGHIRVTWPNGTVQTQSLLCVPGDIDVPRVFTLSLPNNAPPTVSVELELHYESNNRRRQADGSGFDYQPVPGPLHRQQTLTP